MFPLQLSEVILAINFPNSPADGATYTEGTVQWRYSSANNAWTMITTGSVGIDNGTNHDQEVLFLDRNVSNQNIPTAGVGFTYNPTTRKVVVKGAVSQTNNFIELTDSTDTILNAFNERGILSKAGRIYYQSGTPSVASADTGQLWYNSGINTLNIWNGTSWVSAGGGVDIGSAQLITGAKSFSSSTGLTLGSNCALVGETNLVFKPTGVTKLTLSSTEATFAVPVNFSAVGSDVKDAVVTKADSMTVDGVKTFSGTINAASGILMNSGSGTSRIFSSAATTAGAVTNKIIIQPSQSSTGRYIELYSNSNTLDTQGITIRAKNENNQGNLNIVGNTKITGNLEITGTISVATNAVTFGATSIGSFKSQSGTGTGNLNTAPPPIGPLTFSQTLDTSTWLPTTTVTNNSSSTVAFYYKREQVKNTGNFTYGITKFTLNGNSSLTVPITGIADMGSSASSPASAYTKTAIVSHTVATLLASETDAPIVTSFILCPV